MKAILQFLWQLPVTITVWGFYLLLFWALGLLHAPMYNHKGRYFLFLAKDSKKVWAWAWKRWLGHALPYAIVIAESQYYALHGGIYRLGLYHEEEHLPQWRAWGILFPFVWMALTLIFGYVNNPFEIQATERAIERHYGCSKP